MLRKIALSSMKGRKKDTLILSSVIILSFIFITIATVFHASSERTKYEQKTAMFGKWDLAYYDGDKEIEEKLLGLSDVEKLGVSRIIGRSSTCGTVGTFNQELIDLGSFNIYEGRMPEDVDEIALELNQLKQFREDIKVGDTIPVRIDILISERDKLEASIEQTDRIIPELEGIALKLGMSKPEDLAKIYEEYSDKLLRNTQSLEGFNGTEVGVKTSYIYKFVKSEKDGSVDSSGEQFENIKKYGSIISQRAYITRNMIVTGIVQTYSNFWDKSHYPVANAFITENTGRYLIEEGYYLSEEVDSSKYRTVHHFFIDTILSPERFYEKHNNDFKKLVINSYLHSDEEGSTENRLVYGILLLVFIATIFIVFLIYFTQMKRRSRRIALLKSIGATNDQIGKLLFWEACYLLIVTIPIGVISGIGIGKIILLIANRYGKTELNFYIDYKLTILGILVGILAIIISMVFPMIMSMKIPLTGSISEPPKRKKIFTRFKKDKDKSKELNLEKSPIRINRKIKQINLDMKIQTFGRISFKNIKYHKGKHLLTSSLYTITLTVLLGCVFLSFLFFGDYINKVIITGKPSYGFEVNYGMTRDETIDFTEDINSIEGVTNVDIYKGGERAFLWYEGIEDNKLYLAYKKNLPSKLINDYFGTNSTDYVNLDGSDDYLVKNAIIINIYGIDVEASIFNKFENAITKGSLDKKRFEAGEEVILMLPINDKFKGYYIRTDLDKEQEIMKVLKNKRKKMLNNEVKKDNLDKTKEIISNTEEKNVMKVLLEYNNICDITYDFRKSKDYFYDHSIKAGDRIYLTIPTENYIDNVKTNDVAFNDVEVAALIYYFPERGIWPFAETIENPVVIGSYNLTERLYPSTILGKGRMDNTALQIRIKTMTPTRYGKSWVFVETDGNSFQAQSLTSLQKRAKERGFKLHDYKESNDIIYKKAFNLTLIIVILGIAVAVITSIILYNTSLSKLEQERARIGTFQALGVTKEQFQKQYLITGFSYGMISLVISHIVLIIAIMFTSIGNSRPMLMNTKEYINYIIQDQLWLYPWIIHISICIIFFATAILTYYLPLKKILNNQPIDNIRSLGR